MGTTVHTPHDGRLSGAVLTRLVLLLLLTVGVIGMHTLGHPGEASAAASPTPTGAPASSMHEPAAPAHHEDCPPRGCGDPRNDHGSEHGTDPASICVAVLVAGIGALASAVALLALRRRRDHRVLRTQARWAHLNLGLPPPRPPDLALLRVLRI
ncbi:DUF6153 family protein [Embleya sp. NPDC005575]|uniref:DUF6153 family protein n=1 Tax=Embleya sp. NPDC005575 TaxID=3156892 RepID=UPI0033B3F8CE